LVEQTVLRHLLDPVPVLTEIARSLVLGWKFGLQAASLARISVRDLKKHRLQPFSNLDSVGKLLRIDCSFVKVRRVRLRG
jgi:hypothetical protein